MKERERVGERERDGGREKGRGIIYGLVYIYIFSIYVH